MSRYFRLLDASRKGTIVKADGMKQFEHVPEQGWVRSGVLLEYTWPESPTYDMYEEIPESEALILVK